MIYIEFRDFKNFNEEVFLEDVRSLDTLNLDRNNDPKYCG